MKIQLTIAINFIPSKYNDEERVMLSKSDNKEIKNGKMTKQVNEKLFESLLKRYQNRLETSMRDCGFFFVFIYYIMS